MAVGPVHIGKVNPLEDFEVHLGKLYEGLEAKISATSMFHKFSRRIEWLEALSCHASALGALARILREEGRKSFNLRFNIISMFFMFSLFPRFHEFLLEQKIGKTTLELLILEIQCTEALLGERESENLPACNKSKELNIPNVAIMPQNSQQERLLYMAISLLLNMAEDVSVEKRMQKCHLVEHLCKILNRKSVALLTITVSFLKKLSIFKENKDAMKENGIIFRISALFPCPNESLLLAALRLLWNLSFDANLRSDMVRCDIIPMLVTLVKEHKFEHLVYGLLYNLSLDSIGRLKFAETEVVAMLFQIILAEPMKLVTGELMALAVNLTCVPANSELMCKPRAMEQLLSRAISFQDPIFFKVIRNISQLNSAKPQMTFALPGLVTLLLAPETSLCLQVEVMGTLTNMSSVETSFDVLLKQTHLLQFLAAHLQGGVMEDDFVLEVTMFVGGICSETTAPLISSCGLVERMCSVFLELQRDKEITTQLLYTFCKFLLYEPTRKDILFFDMKVVVSILELSQDAKATNLRDIANITMELIAEVDPKWSNKLRWLKFATYNLCRLPLL